jgi:hypothetical protein
MGKVAADNSHKWVYREPLEHGNNGMSSPWHGSMDPHPRTWEAQFKAGIQVFLLLYNSYFQMVPPLDRQFSLLDRFIPS